jgi:uncharacterized membrane protein (DUF485 family)
MRTDARNCTRLLQFAQVHQQRLKSFSSVVRIGDVSSATRFTASVHLPTLIEINLDERHTMHHEPAQDTGADAASALKTRVGLVLFAIYGLIYAGFVAINTFFPAVMGAIVFAGLNLAVVYGFGLIFLAIIMGLIYNLICTRAEDRMNHTDRGSDHDL